MGTEVSGRNFSKESISTMGLWMRFVDDMRFHDYMASSVFDISNWHIEAGKKWSPFCRRHIQTCLLQWKYQNFVQTSLKFVPKGPITDIPSLVHIMAWRRPGDKQISEPMTLELPAHICVTRPETDVRDAFIKKHTPPYPIIFEYHNH